MIRKTLVVLLSLLAGMALALALLTCLVGFAYCAQRGEADLKMYIDTDSEQGILSVSVTRLTRADVGPPPIPVQRPSTEFSGSMFAVYFTEWTAPEATSGYGLQAGSAEDSCSIYFQDLRPGDVLETIHVMVLFPLLFSLSVALVAYPAIALIRGPLRRHRRRRRGWCPECGYDLSRNATGVCPGCGMMAGDRADRG